MKLYAVKDEMSNLFLTPTPFKTEGEAKRQFKDAINNNRIWKDNPADFSLYKLGEYNEETGEIDAKLEKVISGHAFRE